MLMNSSHFNMHVNEKKSEDSGKNRTCYLGRVDLVLHQKRDILKAQLKIECVNAINIERRLMQI